MLCVWLCVCERERGGCVCDERPEREIERECVVVERESE